METERQPQPPTTRQLSRTSAAGGGVRLRFPAAAGAAVPADAGGRPSGAPGVSGGVHPGDIAKLPPRRAANRGEAGRACVPAATAWALPPLEAPPTAARGVETRPSVVPMASARVGVIDRGPCPTATHGRADGCVGPPALPAAGAAEPAAAAGGVLQQLAGGGEADDEAGESNRCEVWDCSMERALSTVFGAAAAAGRPAPAEGPGPAFGAAPRPDRYGRGISLPASDLAEAATCGEDRHWFKDDMAVPVDSGRHNLEFTGEECLGILWPKNAGL
mmetsp:Transcript_50318/g.157525  ORF Transcript_50318/g.157525 Transcript_50318/m.157525 type:complete len:275 (-) Transcript_50318:1295-2119(-)